MQCREAVEHVSLMVSARLLGLLEDGMGDWIMDTEVNAELRAVVDGLLAARGAARLAKDWGRADAIRKGLDAAGVVVQDKPDGSFTFEFGAEFDAGKLAALG